MIETIYEAGYLITSAVEDLFSFIFGTIPSSLANILGISTSTTWFALISTPALIVVIVSVIIGRWVLKSVL